MSNRRQLPKVKSQKSAINEEGFTLLEMLVSMAIILVASVGFFGFTVSVIQNRASLARSNFGYNMAVDVADRLSKLNRANSLILPNSSGVIKHVGYDTNSILRKCSGTTLTSNAPGNDPATGMTEYSNPVGSNALYLYDNNLGTFSDGVTITSSANTSIDHPNAADLSDLGSTNNIKTTVDPIRKNENGITYYVVWSVAYMPCGSTDKSNIFITVYWIEPEPSETSVSAVNSKIASGAYKLKNVSLSIDKAYRIE